MPKSHGDVVVENTLSLYTTFELLTVMFGFVIFMGAITGVACVCTGRKRYVSCVPFILSSLRVTRTRATVKSSLSNNYDWRERMREK